MIMRRAALTGGIATGKSYCLERFASLGARVVDADRLAREAVAPGTAGLARVVERFGPEFLLPDGSLDRPSLGRLVFGAAPNAQASPTGSRSTLVLPSSATPTPARPTQRKSTARREPISRRSFIQRSTAGLTNGSRTFRRGRRSPSPTFLCCSKLATSTTSSW